MITRRSVVGSFVLSLRIYVQNSYLGNSARTHVSITVSQYVCLTTAISITQYEQRRPIQLTHTTL